MIRRFVDKNCQAVFTHPLHYLFVLIVLSGIAAWFYATLPTETSVESLIIDDDPDLIFYETFKEQFGEDEFLVVGFQHQDLFSPNVLATIKEQTDKVEKIDEVKEVVSLTNVENILGTEFDFIVQPLVETLPQTEAESSTIETNAENNPLIYNNLFSSRTDSALFLIRTEAHPGDETYDARLISQVEEIFNDRPLGIAYHIAGWLVTDVSMSQSMARDLMIFMPLTFGVIALLLWVFLRNKYVVAISLLTVTITLIWTMALLNLIGGAISPMTSILSPLIMALIVADCVHIFRNFLQPVTGAGDPVQAIHDTLVKLSVPCFLTSLTTAIGFASLGLSDIPPIRHLGLAAAGGMLIEFVLSITIIPLCIYALRHKTGVMNCALTTNTLSCDSLLMSLSSFVVKHNKLIFVGSMLLMAASFYGMLQINVETNLLDYFKKGSQVRADTDFFDANLGGSTTLEVSVKSAEIDFFKKPEALKLLEAIEQHVCTWPFVSKATSVTSFLKQMNASFNNNDSMFYQVPQSKNLISQYLLLYDGDELGYFINDEYNWARLSFRIHEHSSKVLEKKIQELNHDLVQKFPSESVELRVTGKTFLVTKLVKGIVNSQTQSLTVAFVIIFFCLFLVFRSVGIGMLSIVPNLFPILINFGIMGLFAIPLNTATAIISAIAIGIAVDDTIHYLVHYQELRHAKKSILEAMTESIREKGGPIITTSVILTGGFAVLCFSSFVPTIQFGLLCSIIMFSAVIGDLLVLPAMLAVLGLQSNR
ncbi:MMPL family transporter [uncultured Desulfuromonas sp.]|uniref:efflux RND transporter permease subunit n=1 Tax=uncultured Desulfuromonas sp. TaxID=181013 RepID=UPI002AAC2684|nr:MMPL family transporter [uncultured Desulfuromonas sp.]